MILTSIVKAVLLVSFMLTSSVQQEVSNVRRHFPGLIYSNKSSQEASSILHQSEPFYSKNLSVSFLHFTRKKPQVEYDIQPTLSSLRNSRFDSTLRTIIIIHGYGGVPKGSLYFDMKDELLKEGNYNIIVVDWTKYALGTLREASIYAEQVGREISKLLQFLMTSTGISAESVHLIGHSLGSQVAAFAGKTTPNIGRITGLDAAGPSIENPLRLTHTDAIFVDAIHTNGAFLIGDGYGVPYPYASQDFFPNGGKVQPGCENNRTYQTTDKSINNVNTTVKRNSCSHVQSVHYFMESINRKCQFLSVLCDSYECLLQGKCGSAIVAPMGFHARPIPFLPQNAKFYLRTRAEKPFCIPR